MLLGIYANFLQLKSDHVAVYHVPHWEQAHDIPHLGLEIAEVGFFPVTDLPEGTSPGTKQRIEEFLSGRTPTEYW